MIAQYADDVVILRATPQRLYNTNLLNKHIEVVLNWYDDWRIAINGSKSVAVYFSRKA